LGALACLVPLAMATGSGPATAATDAARRASAPGVTATTIQLGLIAAETGPASSTFGDSATGAQARIALQNAQGGVDGRKLQLEVVDDTSTQSGSRTAAEDLVSSKGVFGVMSDSTALTGGGADFLLQQGVPVTEQSSLTGSEPKYTDEFTYVQGQTPTPSTSLDAAFFKSIGVHDVGYVTYNDPQDIAGFGAEKQGYAAGGLHFCYGDLVPIGAVNFTTIVLSMKGANCQGVFLSAVESSDIAMATAIEQAGLHIKQLYATGYDQNFLDNTEARTVAQGQYFRILVPLDLDTPPVKRFYAALKKYDPSYKGGLASFGAQTGWIIADEMIQGLEVAGPNPTRASFIKNLAQVKDYTIGGLNPTGVDLSKRWKLVGPQCAYFAQLEGSKFLPYPRDGKPICGKVVGGG
jgi:ABC-type branched-subunit amino acid transport system substrate-binding protein